MDDEIIIIITPTTKPSLVEGGAASALMARFYGNVTRESLIAAQHEITARLVKLARTVDEE